VGLFKSLLKITLLIVLAGAVAGVVALVKRPRGEPSPVSYDQWPDVAEKPAS
jgi:hypothetical protein